jgi:hypothetical protein
MTPWNYKPVKNPKDGLPQQRSVKRACAEVLLYVWLLEFHEDRHWLTRAVWTEADCKAYGTNVVQGGTRIPDRDCLKSLLRNLAAFDMVWTSDQLFGGPSDVCPELAALRTECREASLQPFAHSTCTNDLQTLIKIAAIKNGLDAPKFKPTKDENLWRAMHDLGEFEARRSWVNTVVSNQVAVARFRDVLASCVLAAMDDAPVVYALLSTMTERGVNPYTQEHYRVPYERLDRGDPRLEYVYALVDAANVDPSRLEIFSKASREHAPLRVNPLEVYLYRRSGMKFDGAVRTFAVKPPAKRGPYARKRIRVPEDECGAFKLQRSEEEEGWERDLEAEGGVDQEGVGEEEQQPQPGYGYGYGYGYGWGNNTTEPTLGVPAHVCDCVGSCDHVKGENYEEVLEWCALATPGGQQGHLVAKGGLLGDQDGGDASNLSCPWDLVGDWCNIEDLCVSFVGSGSLYQQVGHDTQDDPEKEEEEEEGEEEPVPCVEEGAQDEEEEEEEPVPCVEEEPEEEEEPAVCMDA